MDEREIERLTLLLGEIESAIRLLRENFHQAVLNEDDLAAYAFGDDIDDIWTYVYVGDK